MGDDAKGDSAIKTILVGLILAALVGSAAPWWWDKVFPPHVVITTTGHMGELEGGINRSGGDLDLVGIQGNSAAECSDLCASNGNCKAMTFVKHAEANGGICWQKGKVPPAVANPQMVSAIKLP